MRKLSVYDQAKKMEVFTITLVYNQTVQALNRALEELRELSQGHSIEGWINEYDLKWSTTECVNKHPLEV